MGLFDVLYAKRPDSDSPPSSLLLQHLVDAHDAASVVLKASGSQQLSAFGLVDGQIAHRFERLVKCAAIFHDLGKANGHFQAMIRHGRLPQALRHEWITVAMLQQLGWREWIAPALANGADFDLLCWTIASHHLKHADKCNDQGAGSKIELLQDHPDFQACLQTITDRLELASPPPVHATVVRKDDLLNAFAFTRARWLERDETVGRLLAAAKATLIAADVGASALPVNNVPLEWIGQRLSITPTKAEFDQLVTDRLADRTMYDFQRDGGLSTKRVTFVKAGCGSGKTLLAYHWAANRSPVRRLYMCYPTTGTATEGFRHYLFDEKTGEAKFGAQLFHSRAAVDIERILHVERDEDDEEAQLASLDAWSTPIVVATVDTVLGLMQSQRRAMYAWPALAQSAFCFDEIHSYDNKMFGGLLRFLKELRGVPVLLMTASLPEPRLEAIKDVLKAQNDELREIAGPAELEELIRYRQLHVADVDETIRSHLAGGGKVLWVCNTVGRAMNAFGRLKDQCPLLYHSRFRYGDRVDRHADLITAFDPNKPSEGVLAIATQVAEMSLDISATMLVSDLAPIPALIQRLGRLNRRAQPSQTSAMPFVVVPVQDELPYKKELYGDWQAITRQWLDRLGNGDLSQRMLADTWDSSLDPLPRFNQDSTWLDCRCSCPDSVRDDTIGVSVLLEEDRVEAARDHRRFIESVIPMNQPKRSDWREWPRVRGVPVTPEDALEYDVMKGATWK